MGGAPAIPLTGAAGEALGRLARATGSGAIAALDGATILGERAAMLGYCVPGLVSAGGGCRLYPANDGWIALNLARVADRELLPALFEDDRVEIADDEAVAAAIRRSMAAALVERGRLLGLAIASLNEDRLRGMIPALLASGEPVEAPARRAPRVLDLSALWAGPLAAHLLWLAGAEVIKVENPGRPETMRREQPGFYALLNQGKASVALDLRQPADREALLALIAGADIVIEASRPRALLQLGTDATRIVEAQPGLVWMTLTAYGATGEAANWIGFGDDVAVAAGLSAALAAAGGQMGFVGDAIADPLTGIHIAEHAWNAWRAGRGGRYGIAMHDVVASCIAAERDCDAAGFDASLRAWSAVNGRSFPAVVPRTIGSVAPFGSDPPRWRTAC